jgi:hypothetical protein
MLKLISFALRYYPLILIGVNVIETVMSGKSGEEKKAALVSALKSLAVRLGVKMDAPRERLVSEAIDLIVAIFNVTGSFKLPDPIDAPLVVVEIAKVVTPVNDSRLDELEAALLR